VTKEKPSTLFVIPPGTNGCPTTDELRRDFSRTVGSLPEDIEDAIVSVASQMPAPGETHRACADRRMRLMRELFDQLSVAQAIFLGKRLDRGGNSDPIVIALRRVSPDHYQRLRAYLADARRRMALRATSPKET
jgi:hypothetical protein